MTFYDSFWFWSYNNFTLIVLVNYFMIIRRVTVELKLSLKSYRTQQSLSIWAFYTSDLTLTCLNGRLQAYWLEWIGHSCSVYRYVYISPPCCLWSLGSPLRTLPAVSDCWVIAHPTASEQQGGQPNTGFLGEGCCCWISAHFNLSRCEL